MDTDSDYDTYDDADYSESNNEQVAGSFGIVDSDSNLTLSTNDIILLSCLMIFVSLVIAICAYCFIRSRIKLQQEIKETANQNTMTIERIDSIDIEAEKKRSNN